MSHEPNEHGDLDLLFEQISRFAMQQRGQYEDMLPFGMTMPEDGPGAIVSADGEDTSEMVAMLRASLGQSLREGSSRAVALAFDATVQDTQGKKMDALIFDLAHLGEAVRLFIPYKKGLLGGVKFGEILRAPLDSNLFLEAADNPEIEAVALDAEEILEGLSEDLEALLDSYLEGNAFPPHGESRRALAGDLAARVLQEIETDPPEAADTLRAMLDEPLVEKVLVMMTRRELIRSELEG